MAETVVCGVIELETKTRDCKIPKVEVETYFCEIVEFESECEVITLEAKTVEVCEMVE